MTLPKETENVNSEVDASLLATGNTGSQVQDQLGHTSQTYLTVQANNFTDYLFLLPTFSGDNDDASIKEIIYEFEKTGEIAHWGDKELVAAVKIKLQGEAASFARNNPYVRKAQNWSDIKNELIKRYDRLVEADSISCFTQTVQKPNESSRSFLSKLSGLAHQCFPTDEIIREKLLFNQALKGLNGNTRRFVMAQSPTTFTQIWDLALQEERCALFDKKQSTQIEVNAAMITDSHSNNSSELAEIKQMLRANMSEADRKINQLTEQVANLTMLVNRQNQQPPLPNQFFSTPQPNQFFPPPHFVQFPPPRRPRNNIICYKCNQPGHISRFCNSQIPLNNSEN